MNQSMLFHPAAASSESLLDAIGMPLCVPTSTECMDVGEHVNVACHSMSVHQPQRHTVSILAKKGSRALVRAQAGVPNRQSVWPVTDRQHR